MTDTDERDELAELLDEDPQLARAVADLDADEQLLRALVAARKSAGLTQSDVASVIACRARGDAKKALRKVQQYESGQNMHNVSLWYVRAYGRAVGVRVTSEVVAA